MKAVIAMKLRQLAFGKYIRKQKPRFIRLQMAGKGQYGHLLRDLAEVWRM